MPQNSQKVPSQIFRWFEKMKSNYEQSVQGVLERFEQYNESQQLRLDNANQSHIDNLKQSHQNQLEQQSAHINQLSEDVAYYKAQIMKQQQTIEQLNGRYDAVMSCLLTEKRKDIDVKDVFSDHFVEDDNSQSIEKFDSIVSSKSNFDGNADLTQYPTDIENTSKLEDTSEINKDELFDQALLKRGSGDNEQAFLLFEQAATLGHVKSMGAMGRSFFLGEGTLENHEMGLAWLINAAENALPQAIARVEHFKDVDPELYQEAVTLAEQLKLP
jgi:TPR repeat protein